MSEAKSKKKFNPLIGVIAVLVLVIVGLSGYFLFIKKASSNGPYVPPAIVEATWTTDEFLVNLADTDTDRYLKTKIVFTYDSGDKELATELDSKQYGIRDAVIRVIRSKKSTEINTPAGIDTMKVEMIKKINAYLGGNRIVNAYYSDVLIQ